MRRPTGILLFAVVALLSLASLAELRVTGAQTPAGESAFLQPGLNWVGWLGEERSVQDLFDAVPDLKSVWVWEASWQGWRGAYREPVPGRELTEVHPGMALWMWIDGSHPVRWPYGGQSPATGLVELHKGQNYVTWGGGPDFDLAQFVYDGVGISLEDVMVWRSGEARWQKLDPWNRVARGDVLWVKVARDVNWLQPTGEWPDVVFAGEVSSHVLGLVYRDLKAAMTFFAEEWGVQADHSRTTLYVVIDDRDARDARDDLERVIPDKWADYPCEDVGETWATEEIAAWHCGGSEGVSSIVLRKSRWYDTKAPLRNTNESLFEGKYDLVHEYAHAVQHQLSGGIPGGLQDHPLWLKEGMAFWVEGLLYVDDQGRDRDWLRRDNEVRLQGLRPGCPHYNLHAPDLESLAVKGEHGSGAYRPCEPDGSGAYRSWEYELGSIAVERLAGSALGGRHENQDSIIEYWRQSLYRCEDEYDEVTGRTIICGLGDDEPDAFSLAFGRTIDRFYEEFASWRKSFDEGGRELPGDAMSDGPLPDGELSGGPFAGGSQYPR